MNLSNFTIKAAEAIQQSQQLAFNHSNANIETEHLLKALLDGRDSPVEFLLKKNAVNVQQMENRLDAQMEKLPKVSGGDPAQGIPIFLWALHGRWCFASIADCSEICAWMMTSTSAEIWMGLNARNVSW